MKLTVERQNNVNFDQVSTLCPHCGKEGTFDPIGTDLSIDQVTVCGQRKCPNTACRGHLFVVMENGHLIASYPAVTIDFDATDVPERVRSTLEEALTCHANSCFVASAMLVRRTLEEICHDRGATGANLKARIKDLESRIVLPAELMEAMNELRLLGNDAAHIEAQTFSSISKRELDIAIEFAKEIIKGLYQYSSLLEKIRALKTESVDT
jgi:hypothetical protein